MTIDPREERLPKWAREELQRLRRQRDEFRTMAEEARLRTNPDASDAVIEPYADIPIGLGKRPWIRLFPIKDDRRSYLDVRVQDGEVEVMSDGRITVTPQAGNVILVAPRGR